MPDNIELSSLPLNFSEIKYHLVHGNIDPSKHNLQKKPHIHGCYEIYINIAGDVSFLVNNKLYPVKKGDIILSRPGDVHICVYNSPCLHEHFCLWFELASGSPFTDFTVKDDFSNLFSLSSKAREALLDIFYKLELSQRDNSPLFTSSYILHLLALLSEPSSKNEGEPKSAIPSEMQAILNYIDANFTEIQYVGDVASHFYISTATLNRWFRKYINLSPREFLEAKKLAFAKKLLDEGCTVTEVCIRTGFSDCSHFIAVFKNKFGETPFKYKKAVLS